MLGRLKEFEREEEGEEEDGEIGVFAISHMSVYFTTFESVIVYRNTHRPFYVLTSVKTVSLNVEGRRDWGTKT